MAHESLQIQTVLYHNDLNNLERSLKSLARAIEISRGQTGFPAEAVLAYGDSSASPLLTKETVAAVCERYQPYFEFRYTCFDGNFGTAKGHNLLGADCQSDYMLVMNPDVILAPNAIVEMMKPFASKDRKTGLVEARQVPVEHPKEYDRQTGETGWATTACVIFSTILFHKLKGFDAETFFMYCDDVDFSWRIRLEGYKIIYQPSAMVFHAKALSSKGHWIPTGAEQYYSAEAALLMAYKWSNPTLLNQILHNFQVSGDKNVNKAAEAFLKRKEEGHLPVPLDPEHRVSNFVGYHYSRHRFVL